MEITTKMIVIVIAITSMALSPSLMFPPQSVDANTYCDNGKSESWVEGCKQGWYDHDHCKKYNPWKGDYASGYKVGWKKGSCK